MHRVLAQNLTIPWGVSGKRTITGLSLPFSSIGDIVGKIVPFVFAFAGIGLLLMLIFSGFALLTSAGDAKKLESGKQRITHALVGFAIIFVAYWMVQLAGKIFGIQEINTIFR